MRKQNGGEIKLRRLVVRNYKVLDSLDIEFPPPRMKGDPDIMVMGSKNGLGKTSVLESCAWLFLAAATHLDVVPPLPIKDWEMPVDYPDLLIRSGAKEAQIEGTFSLDGVEFRLMLSIARSGKFRIEGDVRHLRRIMPSPGSGIPGLPWPNIVAIFGVDYEPLWLPPLLYLHSYRKVREGDVELEGIVRRQQHIHRYEPGFRGSNSTFKLEVLQAMMSRAGLFEGHHEQEGGGVLDKLNELIRRFGGGTIEKLRPSQDSRIEFRVTPTEGGESYSFDGLSSGQKEIISTLFLIWHYTRSRPGIVLIDEPELHLNAEWHRSFIRQLHELAPRNQYIIATHSERVFSSVPEDRRLLLQMQGAAAR